MATRQFTAPETTEGHSDYLEVEGKFHFIIEAMRDGKNSKGDVYKGFTFDVKVAEGEHAGKKVGLSLSDPDPTHKDQGDFARRRQAAFLIATNLMAPSQLGKPVAFDPDNALGAQFVAELVHSKDQNKKPTKFLEIKGTNIYHVDDPRVMDVPKDNETLSIIDPANRRKPEYFEPLMKKAATKSAPAKNDFDCSDL